ncbi:hypothetical protein [Clostridium cylindrosporum]|uniref:Uncharacterized protein n=1 Tax=Clostridium cylindrosporum DSM 605 TaxID=1121307 RepID=A0A0J8D971_CLOCY|nr:hypothetical protein [Clostridium cylindrosporum]KMT20828.1 hypothetical protein CLCY_1c00620 [Clostridium cylindrosporum DSM 605]
MDNYVIVVFACLVLSFILLLPMMSLEDKFINITFKAFILFGIIRYISLFIFYSADSPKYIYNMRYFPNISLITILAIGYIMIFYIVKRSFKIADFFILASIVFLGAYIVYNLPIGISNSDLGYILIENKQWIYIESIFTMVVSVILIAISLKMFANIKEIKSKISLLMISISFLVVVAERGLDIMNKELFHFNVLSDLTSLIAFTLIIIMNLIGKNKQNS